MLGTAQPELWVSYWIRVPVNYSRGSGPYNNKWLTIWMGDNTLYDDMYVSFIVARDTAGTPSTNADMTLQYYDGLGAAHTVNVYPNFLRTEDAGRWMHNVYHFKASSGNGATDGEVAWYRKWKGDINYETVGLAQNIEMIVSQKSLDAGFSGFYEGYLMGYASDPYANDTEWLLDNFELALTNIFGV